MVDGDSRPGAGLDAAERRADEQDDTVGALARRHAATAEEARGLILEAARGRKKAVEVWALQLLGHTEAAISSHADGGLKRATQPYRDWFHADGCEYAAVACLGLRMALGLPMPEDIADIAEALVGAHFGELRDELHDVAAPLPKASRGDLAQPPPPAHDVVTIVGTRSAPDHDSDRFGLWNELLEDNAGSATATIGLVEAKVGQLRDSRGNLTTCEFPAGDTQVQLADHVAVRFERDPDPGARS